MAKEWREVVIWGGGGAVVCGVIGALIGIDHFENPWVGAVVGGSAGVVVGVIGGTVIASHTGSH